MSAAHMQLGWLQLGLLIAAIFLLGGSATCLHAEDTSCSKAHPQQHNTRGEQASGEQCPHVVLCTTANHAATALQPAPVPTDSFSSGLVAGSPLTLPPAEIFVGVFINAHSFPLTADRPLHLLYEVFLN